MHADLWRGLRFDAACGMQAQEAYQQAVERFNDAQKEVEGLLSTREDAYQALLGVHPPPGEHLAIPQSGSGGLRGAFGFSRSASSGLSHTDLFI